MHTIIGWLGGLEPWQSVAVSGMLLLVSLMVSALICVMAFKHIDNMPSTPTITEDELKRRRAHAAFMVATRPKLRGMR